MMICQVVKYILSMLLTVGLLAGCKSPQQHKEDIDSRAQEIIDHTWDEDFGPKVNYEMVDVTPEPNSLQVEKIVPESGIVDLPAAVALATVYNRQYQLQREELFIRALDLRLVQHNYDYQLFGTAAGGYGADGDDQAIGADMNFGFNRLLPGGATVGANLAGAWVEILSGNLRGGLASVLNITVAVPILRGSGRDIVMEELTQAQRDMLYQVRTFNRFRQDFVVDVLTQYYQVLETQWYAHNAQDNYQQLIRIHQQARDLARNGRLPQYELDQARQEMLQARDEAITSEKTYRRMLDEFKLTLTLPTDLEFELDIGELEALRQQPLEVPDFNEPEVIEVAINRRLDLANTMDAVEDAYRQTIVAADMLRPDLNLAASLNPVSRAQADRFRIENRRSEYLADLALHLPLDRVAEQNAYRRSLITYNQRVRQQQEAVDLVMLDVRNALRDFREAAERFEIQQEGLELAEYRLGNTLELLRYRRADIRDVLDAQTDLFDAANEATAALVNYTVAMLNFYRDTGILQVTSDGMWQI